MSPVVQRRRATSVAPSQPELDAHGLAVPRHQPAIATLEADIGPDAARPPVEIPIVARSVRPPANARRPIAQPVTALPGTSQRLPLEQLIARAQAVSQGSDVTEMVIQREADAQPLTGPTSEPSESHAPASPAPVAPMAAAASASSPVQGGPPTGAQLEELAQLLYEPISARIRAELWLDRERAGLMVNLRR